MGTLDRAIFITRILNQFGEWLPRGWVWLRSALGPLQTLLTVMHMVASGNKDYRAAPRDFFDDMHHAFGWGDGALTPSALTQARGKLSEKMCRDLFRRVAGEAGQVRSRSRLRYRDFKRIIAAYGTHTSLTSTAGMKRDFGCPFGEHLAAQALLRVLWDIGGNIAGALRPPTAKPIQSSSAPQSPCSWGRPSPALMTPYNRGTSASAISGKTAHADAPNKKNAGPQNTPMTSDFGMKSILLQLREGEK